MRHCAGRLDRAVPSASERAGRLSSTSVQRNRSRLVLAFGTTIAVVGLLLLLGVASPSLSVASHERTGARLSSFAAPMANCNAVSSPTPSAVLITTPSPIKNTTAGGRISAAMEVQIVNYTAANNGTKVAFPAIFFSFPILPKGNFSMVLLPQILTITAPGWTSPSLASRSAVVPNGLAFNHSQPARMTSQLLAVMATAAYGQLTIELRWHWGNSPNGSKLVNGSWTTPTSKSNWPKSMPSIFYPAPYVSVLNTSGPTAVIGGNYTADLGGAVAGQLFFLEMEFPESGKVVENLGQTAPANATNFTVRMPMLNYIGYLTPGTYLVHIHDVCGAMLYNKSVKAVFAATANVTFFFQPGTCGPITINGTKYSNGTVAVLKPSTVAYNFSLAVCKGHTFKNWVTTGALHIATGSSLLVSASGTFTVQYK
jgi:hypothetical protein